LDFTGSWKSYTFLSGLHPSHGQLGLIISPEGNIFTHPPFAEFAYTMAALGSSSIPLLMAAVVALLIL